MKSVLLGGLAILTGVLLMRTIRPLARVEMTQVQAEKIRGPAPSLAEWASGEMENDLPWPEFREPGCGVGERFFLEGNLDQAQARLKEGSLSFSEDTCADVTEKKRLRSLWGACRAWVRAESGGGRERCRAFLLRERNRVVYENTRDWDHLQEMSLGILANKIFFLAGSHAIFEATQRGELQRLTEALVRREPRHLEFLKIRLWSLWGPRGPIGEEAEEEWENLLEDARALAPADPLLQKWQKAVLQKDRQGLDFSGENPFDIGSTFESD